MEDYKTLRFHKRDFLFDNGIVNLLLDIEDLVDKGAIDSSKYMISLTESFLELSASLEDLDNLYEQLFISVSEKITFWTNNDKYYWDIDSKRIVLGKRFDVLGRSSGNDIKRLTDRSKRTLEELEMTPEQFIKNLIDIAINSIPAGILKGSDEYEEKLNAILKAIVKDLTGLTVNNLIEIEDTIEPTTGVLIHRSREDLAKLDYKLTILDSKPKPEDTCAVCPEEIGFLKFDTNVHMFDADVRGKKIGKWAYLIYRSGTRLNRYFFESSKSLYFYFHSPSLTDLFEIKNRILIRNERIQVKISGSESTKLGNNNFHLFSGDYQKYDFFVNNQFDVLLKLLVGLYKDLSRHEELTSQSIDYTSDIFEQASIVMFTSSGVLKDNVIIYDKMSHLFRFFSMLDNIHISTKNFDKLSIFDYFFMKLNGKQRTIWSYFYEGATTNPKDNDKVMLQELIEKLINFKPLHSYYLKFQYNLFTMKENDQGVKKAVIPEGFRNFERAYLELTQGSNSREILIHELCYTVGRDIGRFLGSSQNKELLFNLRAVNTSEQLIQFLRDFRFAHLKDASERGNDAEGPSRFIFSKEFEEALEALLNIIANNKRIELIRDYLALYSISGYSVGEYYRNKSNK